MTCLSYISAIPVPSGKIRSVGVYNTQVLNQMKTLLNRIQKTWDNETGCLKKKKPPVLFSGFSKIGS